MNERLTWWREEYLNERGVPLCAVLRPAYATTCDTDEMVDAELKDAFLDADWPWTPASSWVDDDVEKDRRIEALQEDLNETLAWLEQAENVLVRLLHKKGIKTPVMVYPDMLCDAVEKLYALD